MNDSEQDTEFWQQKLEELKVEHRDLDDVIARVGEDAPFGQIRIQRLKKRTIYLRLWLTITFRANPMVDLFMKMNSNNRILIKCRYNLILTILDDKEIND